MATKVLIDTNILIYAFMQDSVFYTKSREFLQNLIQDEEVEVCIVEKSLFEMAASLTSPALSNKVSIAEIKEYLQYLTSELFTILYSNPQITATTWRLLFNLPNRKNRIYDLVLASTAIENEVEIIYTKNVKDFEDIKEIKIIDPTSE
jgi:predicted nucleic acid-binding protein